MSMYLKQLCLNDFLKKKKLYSLVENGLAGFCLFGFVVAFFFFLYPVVN